MVPKFLFLLLCLIFNINVVKSDCKSLIECVNTFLSDFSALSNTDKKNDTEISVLQIENGGEVKKIVTDLKSLPDITQDIIIKKNLTKSADILTFDLSKYFNQDLDKLSNPKVFNQDTINNDSDNIQTENRIFNVSTFFNFKRNITESFGKTMDFLNISPLIKSFMKNVSNSGNETKPIMKEMIGNLVKTVDIFNVTKIFNKNSTKLQNIENKPLITSIDFLNLFVNNSTTANNSKSNNIMTNFKEIINRVNITNMKEKIPNLTQITNFMFNMNNTTDTNSRNSLDFSNLFNFNFKFTETNNSVNVDNIIDDLQDSIYKQTQDEQEKYIKEVLKEINNNETGRLEDENKSKVNDTQIKEINKNETVQRLEADIKSKINDKDFIVTETIISPNNVVILPDINIIDEVPNQRPFNKINFTDYLLDYYEDISDNSTDYPIIDYEEFYKDTTNEKVDFIPTEANEIIQEQNSNESHIDNLVADTSVLVPISTIKEEKPFKNRGCNEVGSEYTTVQEAVFPWIVAIFRRNESNNQFSYICDGAIISDSSVLTAAQCVSDAPPANPNDLLVFAGKRSLQSIDSTQKAYKVKEIRVHDNFTSNAGFFANDLAILGTEEAIEYNSNVQSVCLLDNKVTGPISDEMTTGWDGNGSLVPVVLRMTNCNKDNKLHENIYCTTYFKDVTGCPSYGGLHAVKINNNWYLRGIFSDDVTKRTPICTNRNLIYTAVNNYTEFINNQSS